MEKVIPVLIVVLVISGMIAGILGHFGVTAFLFSFPAGVAAGRASSELGSISLKTWQNRRVRGRNSNNSH